MKQKYCENCLHYIVQTFKDGKKEGTLEFCKLLQKKLDKEVTACSAKYESKNPKFLLKG